MTDKQTKAVYIAQQLLAAGFTLAGAAGAIANIEAESAFEPTNVQNSYEKSLGMNDAQYTAAVDSGRYTNFVLDSVGYGICQWTASDRKKGMLKFHRARGQSIGHFETQVDWMIVEIRGYRAAYNTCTTSEDPYLCGYNFCKYYEICDNLEAAAQYRGGLAVKWYDWLSLNIDSASGQDTDVPTKPEPVPDHFQWQIALIQFVMRKDGYWPHEFDGLKSDAFYAALEEYIADMKMC